MKDISKPLEIYLQASANMRQVVLQEIKQFIIINGKKRKTDFSLAFDVDLNEDYERPNILVEVDKKTGDLAYEKLDSISYDPKKKLLWFNSESGNVSQHQLSPDDLTDIFDFLQSVEDGLLDDLVIENGTVNVKE